MNHYRWAAGNLCLSVGAVILGITALFLRSWIAAALQFALALLLWQLYRLQLELARQHKP